MKKILNFYLFTFFILLEIFFITKCTEINSIQNDTINSLANNTHPVLIPYFKQEIYNLTNLEYFKCEDSERDCSGAGVCAAEKDECICFEGYKTNFDKPQDYFSNKPRCNYTLKKQIYAMILAMFPSSGFLHFYLGNSLVGYFQMILFLFVFVFNIAVLISMSMKHVKKVTQVEYRGTLSIMLFTCFLSLICFFWYLFDIFMVFFNVYKDRESVEMMPFFTQQAQV
jgi:hypothetical protein